MKLVASVSVAIFALPLFGACSKANSALRCNEFGFERGCHEPNFTMHFGIEFEPGMSREDFEKKLVEHNVYFVISDDYSLQQVERLGLANSQISSSIVIIDKTNSDSEVVEKFRAYINRDNDVVLVANEFGYWP